MSKEVIEIEHGVTKIEAGAFKDFKDVRAIVIPNSVTEIGDYAFAYCDSLKSVTIPDSVTEIGECAFYMCKSLKDITIPDSVTKIGEYALAYCKSLTSITIPDSVTTIGNYAFWCCDHLTIERKVNEMNKTASRQNQSITLADFISLHYRRGTTDEPTLFIVTDDEDTAINQTYDEALFYCGGVYKASAYLKPEYANAKVRLFTIKDEHTIFVCIEPEDV